MPPALVYRNATGKVETVNLKGMPLGASINYPYRKKSVVLEQDDVLMLHSDGFPELQNSHNEMIGYDQVPDLLQSVGNHVSLRLHAL